MLTFHSEDKPLLCECGNQYKFEFDYKKHFQDSHTTNSDKPYCCSLGENRYADANSLKNISSRIH